MSPPLDHDEPAPPASTTAAGRAGIFRREAVEHHAGTRYEAHLIHLTPTWTRPAYWLLLAVCLVALLYATLGQINEYATGMAVIEAEGRIDITAHATSTVESVSVRPGERVHAGQVLARLYAASETAELDRIDREIELQLVKMLRDPSDTGARAAMITLRAQRELAAARLGERILVAPRPGIVSDVRIRPGQELQTGDIALSLLGEHASFRVIAILPGQYRPLVRPGMLLRLELVGFPYAYQTVPIQAVSDEVVSPAEIRRYLRQPVAETLDVTEAAIMVEARLPGRSFQVQGQELGFYEGMPAQAEVAVRSESILVSLIPGLRAVFGDHVGGI